MNGAVNLILELADKMKQIRLLVKDKDFDLDEWGKLSDEIRKLKLAFLSDPQAINSKFIMDLAKEICELKGE